MSDIPADKIEKAAQTVGEASADAGQTLADHAEQVRKVVGERTEQAREWAGDRASVARDWALDQSDVLRDTVQTKPFASVGVSAASAFAAGLVIGILLARR